jgi:hypothetical protein
MVELRNVKEKSAAMRNQTIGKKPETFSKGFAQSEALTCSHFHPGSVISID